MKEGNVTVTDKFWLKYRELIRSEMIPYQWNVLNDSINVNIEKERNDDTIPNEKSHAIENFKIAAGLSDGHHYGWVFQDSDVYKWLEAVAYSLKEKMDPDLKSLADSVVDLISQAQEEDGYLSTYFTIDSPDRKFKKIRESHELYCAGHFMEAAAAYYKVTGNRTILETACRLADCIDRHFGPENGKIHGADGHEEVEIGLMKLYHITDEQRYLDLCRYFLSVRGTDPEFFAKQQAEDPSQTPLIEGMERWPLSYYQVHLPVLLQKTAEGHAVRLVYLCTAMADAASTSGDEKMLNACRRLWRNIVDKRMYITGGIGSTVLGEAFTLDYDLPEDTMYCETCASIGLSFFAYQMLRSDENGEYADVMERAIYNTILAGMALDGKHFFYVNPLEVVPEKSKKDPTKSHVKAVRPQWLGCACCPPNLARMLASIDQYVYLQKTDRVLTNLFMNCDAEFYIKNQTLKVVQKTNYPWDGDVNFCLNQDKEEKLTFAVRIPGWAENYTFTYNGAETHPTIENGYAYFTGVFKEDTIHFHIDMEIEKWHASTKVSESIGKTVLSRGPFVYCMEGIDNGSSLHCISLNQDSHCSYHFEKDLLGGVGVITADGYREICDTDTLYSKRKNTIHKEPCRLKLIPYYAWANRGENEMRVWIRETL